MRCYGLARCPAKAGSANFYSQMRLFQRAVTTRAPRPPARLPVLAVEPRYLVRETLCKSGVSRAGRCGKGRSRQWDDLADIRFAAPRCVPRSSFPGRISRPREDERFRFVRSGHLRPSCRRLPIALKMRCVGCGMAFRSTPSGSSATDDESPLVAWAAGAR